MIAEIDLFAKEKPSPNLRTRASVKGRVYLVVFFGIISSIIAV